MNLENITLHYQKYLNFHKITDKDVLNVYIVGSHLYGNSCPESDIDLVVIVKNSCEKMFHHSEIVHKIHKEEEIKNIPFRYENNGIDITTYTQDLFTNHLEKNLIKSILCLYVPQRFRLKETINFLEMLKLDFNRLRESIYSIAWKVFLRGRYIIRKEPEKEHLGKKNIVHAIRYFLYGIQIAKNQKIVDYSCANEHYKEIMLTQIDKTNAFTKRQQKIVKKYSNEFNSLLEQLGSHKIKTEAYVAKKKRARKKHKQKIFKHKQN